MLVGFDQIIQGAKLAKTGHSTFKVYAKHLNLIIKDVK